MHRLDSQHLGTLLDEHGNRLVDIFYSAAHELLHVQWFGNITGRQVIQVGEEFLKLQKQIHVSLLLNDKTHATGDWTECMVWLEYDWLPQVLEEGLRAVAYVFSSETGTHYASIQFADRVSRHIPIKLFHDLCPALKWLHTQVRFSPDVGNRGFAAQA